MQRDSGRKDMLIAFEIRIFISITTASESVMEIILPKWFHM